MNDELGTRARLALAHVARTATGAPLDRSWRVTINFHPERLVDGASVLGLLGRDGTYRSQFETGTSNGGLTAAPGGDRWSWERRIFGGVYDDAPAVERPKYGALDHRRRSIGAAPRFGSAHLRLAAAVLDRSTFCFPDSVFLPRHVATSARFDLLPLVEEFDRQSRTDESEATDGGLLDDYVEAHVHGTVNLATDVEALVLDPSFRRTATEDEAYALGVPVTWHEGRRLAVSELDRHPGFRGPHIVDLGHRVGERGLLDAAVLGRAVARDVERPDQIKRLWHCVARFGAPVEPR